jgi:hypothetical protein
MPVLANVKHERFANNIAAGMTQAEAYKASGFRAKHLDSAACKLAGKPKVAARIQELSRRITNAVTRKVSEATAITKELVMRRLLDNAEEAMTVKGGSAVANRAWELIGKELGMFKEPEQKIPLKLEDLPMEVLESMYQEALAAQTAQEQEAAAIQGGDAPAPPKVN